MYTVSFLSAHKPALSVGGSSFWVGTSIIFGESGRRPAVLNEEERSKMNGFASKRYCVSICFARTHCRVAYTSQNIYCSIRGHTI